MGEEMDEYIRMKEKYDALLQEQEGEALTQLTLAGSAYLHARVKNDPEVDQAFTQFREEYYEVYPEDKKQYDPKFLQNFAAFLAAGAFEKRSR
jgi:hypothetical protein